jgi:hypothetical protein
VSFPPPPPVLPHHPKFQNPVTGSPGRGLIWYIIEEFVCSKSYGFKGQNSIVCQDREGAMVLADTHIHRLKKLVNIFRRESVEKEALFWSNL